ncbi:hypothetical protein M9H77_07760 [Catharanthus roseus]|uniref:Uncharacterized protein n=1 Tax=Catharanthus roseus TaxID=4058 RepID=A0ACC0BVW9_CATRO|nr:hypothetical protein M9H77_07760 [Catharanthus roseus]
MNAKTYLIITRYQRSRTADRRPYVTLACERGGSVKKYKKAIVDNEEEEVPKKRRESYGTKKCGCPFKLKGEQMATNKSWQLFVHNERHSHKLAVYNHGHAQAARLTEEPFAHKIYNVVAKIKRNWMQGRNTVEEVLCLSAERGYTVFHRNCEESNGSIINQGEPLVILTGKESRLMPVIDNVFRNSYHMLCRRHIDQNVLAKLTEMVNDEEVAQWFVNGSWKQLINKIDEVEYQRKLELLKTR